MMRPSDWNDFLSRMFIAPPAKKRRRTPNGRTASLQQLEPREMLTASFQVWYNGTQFTNGGSDSFGTVAVGASDSQTWTLKNVGSMPLSVNSDSIPTGFSSSTRPPITIYPSQTYQFQVSLNTSTAGSYSNALDLYTTDSSSDPFVVNVSGTVQAVAGNISLYDGSTQISNGGSDSFGTVVPGATDNKSFTVENTGTGTLNVTAVNLPGSYSVISTLPLSVPPNQSGTLTVTLSTAAAGTFSGQMAITSDSSQNEPFDVNLSGTVAAPTLSLADGSTTIANGGSDSFGTVTQGTNQSKTFTVTNTGGGSLTVSSIALQSPYSLQTSLPLTVASGTSATFVVAMTTGSLGSFPFTMPITSNDPVNGTYDVHLSGTVVPPPPVITVYDGQTVVANNAYGSPDDFGATPLGTPVDKTFDIANSGSSNIAITDASLMLPSDFSLVGTWPTSVSAHGSVPFTVQFNSATAGQVVGMLSFDDGDPAAGVYQFPISANATVPHISVTDRNETYASGVSTDNFGATVVGTPIDRAITISNYGQAPLVLDPTTLLLPAGFSLIGLFPTSVAAGTSTNFTVELDAAAAATYSGTMSFQDNDATASVFSVTLEGTVVAPSGSIGVTDSSAAVVDGQGMIDFGSTAAGTPVSQSFLIKNNGEATLSLDSQTLMVPAGFSVSQLFDTSLAPGATTTLVIQLDNQQGGTFGGQVSFGTSDTQQPTFGFFVRGVVTPPASAVTVLDGASAIANDASDNFGSTPLGTPVQQTLTIENLGTAVLSIDPQSLSATDGFSIVTPPAATVAPGGSTSMVIQLDATTGGNASGHVSFSDNAPTNGTFTINLSGTVLAPAMTVSNSQAGTIVNQTGTLNFGSTPLGSPITGTVTIKNSGTEDLMLDPRSLTLPLGYSLVQAFSGDVPPGTSTTLTLEFDAASMGQVNGEVVFNDSDPTQSPFSFAVTATATTPVIGVLNGTTVQGSNSLDDLGSTTLGAAVEQTLTIENNGQAPLTLNTSSLIAPTGFSVVTPFAGVVNPGSSTTLVIELDAASPGDPTGLLTFVDNDPLTPVFKLHLEGEVQAPALQVWNSGNQLASGASVAVGTTTVGNPIDLTLNIADAGLGALTLDPSSLSVPSGFSVVQTFSSSVASDGGTTLIIALAAAAAGTYTGTLSFNSNDNTQSPFQLSLSGTVKGPTLEVLDGSTILVTGGNQSFGTTPVGTPVEQTWTVENNASSAVTINTADITLPAGFSLVTAPAGTIAAGGNTSMVVELNAGAVGSYSGAFTLPSSDANYPNYTFTLSGTVNSPPVSLSLSDAMTGTPIATGGSDNLGTTGQLTPIYQMVSIQNTSTSTVALDPSSLVLPGGFSLVQAFGSSLIAGGQTVLVIELTAATPGSYSGTASFDYGTSQNPDQFTYSFTASGTVTSPPPQDISLDNVVLPNNIGPRSAETTADPTIGGIVDGTFNGGNVVVQYEVATGSANPDTSGYDGATAAVTVSGTGFSFDPRSVDAALVGYVGSVDVKYRPEIFDAAGNATFGAWINFPLTMIAPPTEAHIDDLDLVNNTGSSADDTYDPRVTAHVGGPFVGASVDVELVVGDGAGNPAGSLPTNPAITGTVSNLSVVGQTFTYDPASDDAALVNYAGTVNLSYRTLEHDSAGNVVATGAWTTFAFTLYPPSPQASVSNFHLVDVTGTNGATSDPTVAGTVTGTFANEVVDVQFSDHGDGHVDGLVPVTAVGTSFTYDPRLSDPTLASYSGTLPLEYRTVEFDANGGQIIGAWVSFPITLVLETTSAVISNLHLTDVTGSAGPPATSDDPSVAGSVTGMQQTGAPDVQFDYNGDGIPDETVAANGQGSFSDSLPGLPYGNVTIAARAVEFDAANGIYLYGAWTTLSFDYVPPPPPAISSLALANVTDTATGGTSDPTVTGTISVGNGLSAVPIEVQFDTTGSGQPNGETLADMQGNFSFTPVGLTYGSVTIAARSVEHGAGPLAYSPWFSLTFTYEAPPANAPVVNSFRLANPSASSLTTASDPTVTGTVAFDELQGSGDPGGAPGQGSGSGSLPGVPSTADMLSQDVNFVKVQFDYNGDGVPDASTTTGPGGTFSFTPSGLTYGQVTLRARAVGRDSQDNPVNGAWTSLTFTYQQAPSNLASVSSLVLANPIPGSAPPGSADPGSATDPTVNGQLAVGNGLSADPSSATATSFLTVELDTNAASQQPSAYAPTASVQADGNGDFSFTPTGLAYGAVTIAARVRQHDYTTGGFDYSAWITLSFTYQAPGNSAPTISSFALVDNSGAAGFTANPEVRGTVTIASPTPNPQSPTPSSVFVQISTTGNGVPNATVFPDANGNFTFTPTNLAYGSITIQARSVGWAPPTTGSGGSGSYVYGTWSSLTFTYEQETFAAPAIAAVGLIDANGNLDGDVSGSPNPSSAQPLVGGQLSYQGSVQGLTVEFAATSGGTPYASVTTDQYGDFSYTPTGLTPGSVTVYVRTISSPLPLGEGQGEGGGTAGDVLIGAWTPFTFAYVAPTIAPPTVSSLTLADDTSGGQLETTDPTISGVAVPETPNPQPHPSLCSST